MTARWAGRKGRDWRALCARVYADPCETHCIRCGKPVDKDLVATDALPPQLRRWARSVDHVVAIDQGGARLSRDNVALAHIGCNSRHGAHVRWAKQRGHTHARIVLDVDPHSL
jgi:5-methylcytosine-specific restriction endonuclease McrA